MSTFKTEAIVLGRRPFIESDRFYTVYSKDHGKLELLARAAAKSSSKLAGHLEPLSKVSLMIAKGKNHETVAGAKLLKTYKFPDLSSQYLAQTAAEIVMKITKNGNGDEKIYNLIDKFLSFLEKGSRLEVKRLSLIRFSWQLLVCLGNWHHDTVFTAISGLPEISDGSKTFFNEAIFKKACLSPFKVTGKILSETEYYTRCYLQYLMESEIKSLSLLDYVKKF